MIYILSDRRKFLDFLSKRDTQPNLNISFAKSSAHLSDIVIPKMKQDSLLVVWRDEMFIDSVEAGFVIIVPDDSYIDFLAWAHTYIKTHHPFTSFFRVIKTSDVERFELLEAQPQWLDRDAVNAFAVVSIAEAIIQTNYSVSTARGVPLRSCMLTFSFAAARGLQAGLHPAQLFDLSERWDAIGSGGKAATRRVAAERLMTFWLLATDALLSDDGAIDKGSWILALAALVQNRAAPLNDVLRSFNDFPALSKAIEKFAETSSLSRERQIKAFDEASKIITESDSPLPLKEAVVGFLSARLGNGSLEYFGLLQGFKDDLSCSPLWFAFFSAYQPGFDGLNISNSLGRHLVRRTLGKRDLFSKLNVHVSFDELRMLSDARLGSTLENIYGSVIEVELLPGIPALVPNPMRKSAASRPVEQRPVDQDRLRYLLHQAIQIIDRPAQPTSTDDDEVARDLFSSNAGGGRSVGARSARRKKV